MNANDVLYYGHQTVVGAVDGLAEEAWFRPNVCGVWSVKDIIAHLASFEYLLVETLRSQTGQEETPTLDRFLRGGQAFNDYEVPQRQDMRVSEVWGEYEETQREAAELLRQFPVEKQRVNGLLPWYGAGYDLEDLIAYSFYGHKREHCAQIMVFRDLLAREQK